MGRFKRKNKYYKSRGKPAEGEDGSEGDNSYNKPFSRLELARAKDYLTNYRNACLYVCYHVGEPVEWTTKTSSIAGIDFCTITRSVAAAPYLKLPAGISAKRRRSLHQLCVDVDLMHEAITDDDLDGKRSIIVSIHDDGFAYVPTFIASPPLPLIPVERCKPWYCIRTGGMQSVAQQTKEGRLLMEALVDQPGNSLRDSIDMIDYKELDGKDLSSVKPPSSSTDKNNWLLVDTPARMQQCAAELTAANLTELAFDLEFWNPSKYLQVTCLLQVCGNHKDYVIDTLAEGVWDLVSLLRPLFRDASIVKIGHAITGDVKSLHRDFGIMVVNAFDTYEASKVLKLEKCGLAAVCAHYGLPNKEDYAQLKATYQNTDWRRRPLTDPMILYGRYDVHYLEALRLLQIRDLTKDDLWDNISASNESKMVAQALAATLKTIAIEEIDVNDDDLQQADDDEGYFTPPDEDEAEDEPERKAKVGARELRMQPGLMKAVTKSQERCLGLWTGVTESLTKNPEYLAILKQTKSGKSGWGTSHATLLNELMEWRKDTAAKYECLEGLICPLDMLVLIASKRPSSESGLRRIKYFLPQMLELSQERQELLTLVKLSLKKDGEPINRTIRLYKRPTSTLWTALKWITIASVTGGVAVVAIVVLRRRRP